MYEKSQPVPKDRLAISAGGCLCDEDYFLNFLLAPANPIIPVPNRSIVVGSGTADGPLKEKIKLPLEAPHEGPSSR